MNLFSNKLKRVGIYLANNIYNSRCYNKNNLPFGFKCIIAEIDVSIYDIGFCDKTNFNEFDFLLYSVCSPLDYLVIIRDFLNTKFAGKIIVGGPGLCNPFLLSTIVDVQAFGRCEGQINLILNGAKLDNVWYNDKDSFVKEKYTWRQPSKLLNLNNRTEKNVGCNQNCKFCQYGYIYKQFKKSNNYNSGIDNRETLFKDINWNLANSRIVSSIDGSTEETRKLINKKLTNNKIIKKIKEAYQVETSKPLKLILYNIIGFHFEKKKDSLLAELINVLEKSDKRKKTHQIWINFKFQHFIPFPLSFFQYEKLNKIDFRKLIFSKYGNHLYNGNNIVSLIYNSFPSWLYTADKLYILRSYRIDEHINKMLKTSYFTGNKKYKLEYYKNNKILGKQSKLPSDNLLII